MKKHFIFLAALMTTSAVFSAATTASLAISNIQARENGSHSLFFTGALPQTEGCNVNDRGVIVDATTSGKVLLAAALTAMTSGKQVVLRIDGCTSINPGVNPSTAPRITMVQVFN